MKVKARMTYRIELNDQEGAALERFIQKVTRSGNTNEVDGEALEVARAFREALAAGNLNPPF